MDEVLELFQHPEHLSKAAGETKALTRTFGGISWATEEEWVRIMTFSITHAPFDLFFRKPLFNTSRHLKMKALRLALRLRLS